MHILLFGSPFNPPHLGHQIVIRQAFELIQDFDELWLLPNYRHAFGKDLAPVADRLTMCNLLIKDLRGQQNSARSRTPLAGVEDGNFDAKKIDRIKLCSLEIDLKLDGSTYHTLQALRTQHPGHTFSFLMGSDQLPIFEKWGNWQKLLQEMHFYVYPRGSHRHPITYPNMTLLESPTQIITNVSSTIVRHRLQNHLPVDHIVPPNVLKYINAHSLYADSI